MDFKKTTTGIPVLNGKHVLLDTGGNRVFFTHAIDAREALASMDENGKPRYLLPEAPAQKFQGEKVQDVFEPGATIQKKEVKNISKEEFQQKEQEGVPGMVTQEEIKEVPDMVTQEEVKEVKEIFKEKPKEEGNKIKRNRRTRAQALKEIKEGNDAEKGDSKEEDK